MKLKITCGRGWVNRRKGSWRLQMAHFLESARVLYQVEKIMLVVHLASSEWSIAIFSPL